VRPPSKPCCPRLCVRRGSARGHVPRADRLRAAADHLVRVRGVRLLHRRLPAPQLRPHWPRRPPPHLRPGVRRHWARLVRHRPRVLGLRHPALAHDRVGRVHHVGHGGDGGAPLLGRPALAGAPRLRRVGGQPVHARRRRRPAVGHHHHRGPQRVQHRPVHGCAAGRGLFFTCAGGQ